MMNELVSMIVPVYNMGDSIKTCVRSLMNQDYPHIEIILVDDGSKDDSYQRCLELAAEDERVAVYHTENRGSGPARNYGVEHASGRYVYFPDADDYLVPHAISTLVVAMNGGEYDLVVCGYEKRNDSGKVIHTKRYEAFSNSGDDIRREYVDYLGDTRKYGIQGAPWNKFFDLEVVKRNNVQFPPLRRHQDEAFIAYYMCHAQHVRFIEDVLYVHYVNDLRKVWQKYPVNYLDVVIGLNNTRKETILTWNAADTQTHAQIKKEYLCNVIRALELSFSPKMNLKRRERMIWLGEAIKQAELCELDAPMNVGKYQKKVLRLVKNAHLRSVYSLLRFKVLVEKIGLKDLVRRII